MKAPFGTKIIRVEEINGRQLVTIKLKWWYAIYTAIASCFSARWYAEQVMEIPVKRKGKEKGK